MCLRLAHYPLTTCRTVAAPHRTYADTAHTVCHFPFTSQHAEKKAIAAQLSLDYPEPHVRTTHRMCVDCHACFKAASLVYNRRLIVDDARSRHVFENGECSIERAGSTPPNRQAQPPAARDDSTEKGALEEEGEAES